MENFYKCVLSLKAGIMLLFLLGIAAPSHAQVFKALGDEQGTVGVPNTIYASCSNGDDVYVAYGVQSGKNYLAYFAKWNGIFWDTLPSLLLMGSQTNGLTAPNVINSMSFYKNELYVAGAFDSVHNVPLALGLIKWNGSSWTNVKMNTSNGQSILSGLIIYNDKLYVSAFTGWMTGKRRNVSSWDGTKWDSIPGLPFYDVGAMAVYNNSLYLTDLTPTDHYMMGYVWNDTSLKKIQSVYEQGGISALDTFNGNIVACGTDSYSNIINVKLFNGTKWTDISKGLKNYYCGTQTDRIFYFKEFGGRLWASGNFYDNTKNIQRHLAVYDGSSWNVFPDTIGAGYPYQLLRTDNKLFVMGGFKTIGNQTVNNIAEIGGKIVKIGGKVYFDRDSNCVFTKGDIPLVNRLVYIDNGAYNTNTDDSGNYNLYVDSGMHTIHVSGQKDLIQMCPSGNADITLNADPDSSYSAMNFAFKLKPGIQDLSVAISPMERLRPGRIVTYVLSYENLGSITINNAYIQMRVDKRLSGLIADSTIFSSNDSTYTFHLKGIKSLERGQIKFDVTASTQLKQGQIVTFFIRADSGLVGKDSDLTNNFDTLNQNVSNSHDPNGKFVSPDGAIAANTSQIKYTILFQNTGNGKAYKVEVLDTIDTNLPLTEVTMNSASHKYVLHINNNVMRWTFDNINLADSTTDEEHSHGYISFSTKLKKGMAVGTEIKNKAYIYFDYNDPVPTNQTMNKITAAVITSIAEKVNISRGINLYPNPANEELKIDNRSPETKKFIIYNSVGQAMTQLQIGKDQREILNTAAFPAGIYFIRGEKGESIKFVIQH